jgi:hypothetical protein
MSSSQVSWWSVCKYVEPVLESVDDWPMIGSPEWLALDDDDLRKVASLFDAARHWALRVEAAQVAMCQASRDVSAALDWRAYANARRGRGKTTFIPS